MGQKPSRKDGIGSFYVVGVCEFNTGINVGRKLRIAHTGHAVCDGAQVESWRKVKSEKHYIEERNGTNETMPSYIGCHAVYAVI